MQSGARITGGRWKGRRIAVAPGVRPSSGVLREALMSRWHQRIAGARVLDLYAGSGAVSLELLGRGAASATLVDDNLKVINQLNKVRRHLGVDRMEIVRDKLPQGIRRLEGPYRLVFADPPYDFEGADRLLEAIGSILAESGELGLEVRSSTDLPAQVSDLELMRLKDYGDSRLAIYARVPRDDDEV